MLIRKCQPNPLGLHYPDSKEAKKRGSQHEELVKVVRSYPFLMDVLHSRQGDGASRH
jgi:hypothetical protein